MGTQMVASSSTFRTQLGWVIKDLSRLLHAAWHGRAYSSTNIKRFSK